MSINEIQESIIEEFDLLEEWMDKYEHIIELGKELPPIDISYKKEDNLIKGCQSRVWLHAYMEHGKLKFIADSDAIITKGLVALIISVLSNHTPLEVAQADLYFIDKIGLKNHLSPTRSNGLLSMVKQMKFYGIAFAQQN